MGFGLAVFGTQFLLDLPAFSLLIPALQRRGYQVVGPVIRSNAIVYDILDGISDLPAGWTADQEAGTYRLRKRTDQALFGYAVSPRGWKPFLHSPELLLYAAHRNGQAFEIIDESPQPPRCAFLGVRSCELAAIAIQDRVLLGETYSDSRYHARRSGLFIASVNCTASQPTCFCASMHTAPPPEAGFDLLLTELVTEERHVFVVEAGSREGAEVLSEIDPPEADAETRHEAEEAVRDAVKGQKRHLDCACLRENLNESFDNPYWDDIAARCLTCGNCTQVCPTCFCTTVEDTSSISGARAERWRRWDSCFSQNFSYIHGGSVLLSAKSRYRQWLTHKLAAWIDQFGSSGCVGCGCCITWCPAAIDITREAAVLGGAAAAQKAR
jgi:Fe-S-cluster-containing hydrogenase component 2